MEDQSDSIVFYTGNTQNITVEAMKDMRRKAVVAAGIISGKMCIRDRSCIVTALYPCRINRGQALSRICLRVMVPFSPMGNTPFEKRLFGRFSFIIEAGNIKVNLE